MSAGADPVPAPSLDFVAESERYPTAALAGSDLHAQIQARVTARRHGPGRRQATDSEQASGELSVAELKASYQAGTPTVSRAEPAAPTRHRHGAKAPATPTTAGPARRLIRLVVLLVLTAVSVIGLRTFVVASYYIPSASMETTLHGCPHCEPDMVLVDKLSYRFKSISRTDVVVFNRPPLAPPEDKQLIKRVIGLPGETVSGHDGHVYIDGKQLIEPYVNPACHGTADFGAVKVPDDTYFMMGDNRCDSFDSRMFGPIPRSSVVGRAFAVIWPAKHLRWL